MRRCGLVLVLACCGPRIRAIGPDVGRDVPGCRRDHNVVDVGDVGDAPLAVVYEHAMFFSTDIPAAVLWPDGTLAFSDKRAWFTAALGAAEATRIAGDAAAALRAAPRHAESNRDETDQPIVELVVRDGSHWRVSDVRGLVRGDRGDGAAAAYRELLARAHGGTTHYAPESIAVDYEPVADYTGELAWPADIAPPIDPDVAGEVVVAATAEPVLRELERDTQRSGRAIVVAGTHVRIRLSRRFRGQAAIDRVLECARER